jgi:DNA-binding transcriptional LysR family regulator
MDRLEELETFLAIVDEGSLTAAARRVGRSPPSVTRSLNALEARLSCRLVERSTRRLALTDAGRSLADGARRVLGDLTDLTCQVSGETAELKGALRVTAPIVFGRMHVAPVVAEFVDAHPKVRADLVLADRNLDLIEEEVDIAVRIGELPDSTLVARMSDG